ncbi:Na+/H+ antiporter NhaC family protein [Acidobacteriota bacterium]
MIDPSWISVLPPILAIILAIYSRQVYISLFAGIYLGRTILSGWNPLTGFASSIEGLIKVFADGDNTKVILFCGLVGALITLSQRSGGVDGFVNVISKRGWVKNRRGAQLLSGMIGILIFIETSISCLIVGSISRPIYDRMKISREKLAYICDSTSAPINLLIPVNAWGAFIIGLLSKENISNPLSVMVSALLYNFYALAAIALVFFLIISGKDFGPMKKAELRALKEGKVLRDNARPVVVDEVIGVKSGPGIRPDAGNMIIPVTAMIIMMPIGLLITGKGDITAGSGATSVLWAVLFSIVTAAVLYRIKGLLKLNEITDLVIKGIGGLVPLMILMMFAFALGDVTRELGTGVYVARLASRFLLPAIIPFILFLASCFIAFSTGTSWGTFAIMVPLAVPLAAGSGINLPVIVAAVLGGGLFGDHCSPISDTTMIASMASACDHIDHVRTQLPYALTAAIIAAILYLLVGIL